MMATGNDSLTFDIVINKSQYLCNAYNKVTENLVFKGKFNAEL